MANYLGGKPEVRKEGRQLVVYGEPFCGKTTSLADPDVKVLLCDMDHNTSPLDNADNVTIYPVDTYEEYLEFKKSVQRGYFEIDKKKIPCTDFDIICMDSFTRFEELVKVWVAESFAPSRAREIKGKFGCQTDWDDLQRTEVQEVRDWQAMTRTHGFNVIWFGHDMAEYNDATKRISKISLALQGKYAAPRITASVDAYLYFSKEEVSNGKETKIVRGVYTQQFGVTRADARMSVEKREKLPNFVPSVKWSKLIPYLGGHIKKNVQISPKDA